MANSPRGPDPDAAIDEERALDEDAAWRLVRRVGRGVRDPVELRVAGRDAALTVHPSGGWRLSAPLTGEARAVLDLYLPLQVRADLVIAQAGQSLDGRIATESGHSHYVTGAGDIRRLHRLRALVDAVVVGAGAVHADDPRLSVREVEGGNPVRVVIDPGGRLDRSRRIFCDGAAPTVVMRRRSDGGGRPGTAERAAGDAPAPPAAKIPQGVSVIDLPAGPSGILEPAAILRALRARGCRRVLIEGGGVTVSRFLDAGVIDRLHVAVAPLLIGSGRPAFTLAPVATLDEALRPRCRVFRLGADVLFDLDLRAPVTPAGPADPDGRR